MLFAHHKTIRLFAELALAVGGGGRNWYAFRCLSSKWITFHCNAGGATVGVENKEFVSLFHHFLLASPRDLLQTFPDIVYILVATGNCEH